MRLDGRDLEPSHHSLRRRAPALHAEGHHTARAVRQIFLPQRIVFVARQTAILHPRHVLMPLQKLRHALRVLAVARHPHMQALQAEIQVVRALRRLDRAKVAHKLHGRLGDIRPRQPEALGIRHAVIALVRLAQAGIFIRVPYPVKPAGIHDRAADSARVTVHIFRGGMHHNIRAPLERAAVDGRCERVVHDERHAVPVRRRRELVEVQHDERRVGDGFAEHGLGIRPERGVQLLGAAIRVYKRDLHAHALHGDGKQIEAAAVNAGGADQMVARAHDIEYGKEDRRLPGRGEHRRRAALQRGNARRNGVICRVLQTRVKIAARLKVKELSHLLAALIFERRALDDGDLPRLAVFGIIPRLYASRTKSKLCHNGSPFVAFLLCNSIRAAAKNSNSKSHGAAHIPNKPIDSCTKIRYAVSRKFC